MMKRFSILILFAVLFSLDMARCQTKNYKEKLQTLYSHTVPLVYCEQLQESLEADEELVILDIRSKEEYEVSHIDGAKMIEYDDFSDEDVKDLPADAKIIVYCSVGYRSEKVGEQLLDLGYKYVKNLYGGIFQWKNDGYKVVNLDSTPTDSVHTYNKNWSQWLLNGVRVY